jgi:uncharacterized protein YfiM (DUF2279 family)
MHAFVLLFALHVGDEHPGGDRWFSQDKAKHFFMAAFIQSGSYSALRSTGLHWTGSIAGATAATAILSVGKEIRDARTGGDPSIKDLVWDAAGAAGASVLLHQTGR